MPNRWPNFSVETRLFCCVFLFCSSVAVFVQFIFLPYILPQAHAGHGILGSASQMGDLIAFHEWAVRSAEQYQKYGWDGLNWHQFGGRHSVVWGLIYAHTIAEPYVLIPIQAALFAFATVVLFQILNLVIDNKKWALYGCVPFVLFPTASFFYTQTHRESLTILATFLMIWFWIKLFDATYLEKQPLKGSLRLVACFMFALLLFYISRYKLIDILLYLTAVSLLPLFLGLTLYRLFTNQVRLHAVVAASLVLALCLWVQRNEAPSIDSVGQVVADHYDIAVSETDPSKPSIEQIKPELANVSTSYGGWEASDWAPEKLDRRFYLLNVLRAGFIRSDKAAHTSVGANYFPKSILQSIAYVPRAAFYGMFLPFPKHWSLEGAHGVSIPLRLVGAFEMTIAYLLWPFFFYLAWVKRKNLNFVIAAFLSFSLLTFFAYVCTNGGTLHRIRYGFFMMLLSFGVLGLLRFSSVTWPKILHSLRQLRTSLPRSAEEH